MWNVLSGILGLDSKMPAYLTKEYDEQIKQELITLNIKRERILSVALILFVTIIIASIFLANGSKNIDNYLSKESIHIHFTLIVISILFLIFTRDLNKTNLKILYAAHRLIVVVVLILCAFIGINNELLNQRPFSYIIAMYSIASLVVLNKKERLTAYLSSYSIYIMGNIFFMGVSWRILEGAIFTLPLLVLALVVSTINYSAIIRNFINQKLIEEQNKQLGSRYKSVEDTLEQRTEQLNQTMELDKLRAVFFSNISHELRTPLNVIYTAEQMLNLICKEENIQNRRSDIIKYNDMVQQNCYRLIRLIENLIDITEIDAGQTNLRLGKHNLVKLVKAVTSATAEYIKDRKINVDFASSTDSLIMAYDDAKMERIMLNLLSNAVKFTPEEGYILVSLHQGPQKAIIRIRDSGIGIPAEMKQMVLEPFVQVDKSISRAREGSGVGLTLVKAFVEMHKGEIKILSEEGIGSEFTIELPINLPPSVEEYSDSAADYISVEKIRMEFSDIYH